MINKIFEKENLCQLLECKVPKTIFDKKFHKLIDEYNKSNNPDFLDKHPELIEYETDF